MSVQTPTKASEWFFRVIHNTRMCATLVAGNAAVYSRRSFSHFFPAPLQRLCDFVFRQGNSSLPVECVICAAGHPEPVRMARILAALPVGCKTTLPKISLAAGLPFSLISRDLKFMVRVLKMPILQDHNSVLLSKKIPVCETCARKAAA